MNSTKLSYAPLIHGQVSTGIDPEGGQVRKIMKESKLIIMNKSC